jgi:muramoyltetrapeptide carboxypeptidase
VDSHSVPIKPPRLNYGDTVGIVAPASAPPDPKAIDRSAEALEELGFKPKLAAHVRRRWGFLAGSDRDRAADLMNMFTDRNVNAIVCVRGGYGTARLLPLLDYKLIRSNAKIFVGYSDITSLHCAFLAKATLISFHGPMLNSDFIKDDFPQFTLTGFLKTLMQPQPAGSVSRGLSVEGREDAVQRSGPKLNANSEKCILRPAKATGQLIGGNLSLLCTTLATPYQPDFKNKILFLEDLDEVPYRFDRMLTHLLNAGLLQQVAGVAIGTNKDCIDPKAKACKEFRQTMKDVFKERLRPLRIPVVLGLPFGHVPLNATLPVGVKATLNGVKADLVIEEAAVS